MATVLTNAQILDVEDGTISADTWIAFADGRIAGRGAGEPDLSADVEIIDVAGATVMPGLIDAHVHLAISTLSATEAAGWSQSYAAARTFERAEKMLRRGFTSVRDVGGADYGVAQAAAEGLVNAPRIFFGGKLLSQTGGHGDLRPLGQHVDCRCEDVAATMIVDGVDEMRRAVRDELRKGADHIKLTVSGGVASPHDEIDAVQFTYDEIRAAVIEAENANRYVTVHAYHPRAIAQALNAGVHCIEHGNLLDDDNLAQMAAQGTWLVPTLVFFELMHQQGAAGALGPGAFAKVEPVRNAGLQAYAKAKAAGIPIAFGTDLIGPMEFAQLNEFLIRAQVTPPDEVLREATVYAAKLLRREGQLGTLQQGAIADAIVLTGNPVENIALLTKPEDNLIHVFKDGVKVA
ncbi:amidohydrolase family protein [Microbacterium sp.]|uniref:metal-dependent hydrolase family protein n=1 Tax=Microbacterium sp. TaxID=51671 RepID=UPI0039E726D3